MRKPLQRPGRTGGAQIFAHQRRKRRGTDARARQSEKLAPGQTQLIIELRIHAYSFVMVSSIFSIMLASVA